MDAFISTFENSDYEIKNFYIAKKVEDRFF